MRILKHHILPVALSTFFLACATTQPKPRATGPSLPLPEPTPEALAELNWPANEPVANSIKAWQYKKDFGAAVQQLGKAISGDALLDKTTAVKIIAIVASRNGCFY